jgi:hypothetical protein
VKKDRSCGHCDGRAPYPAGAHFRIEQIRQIDYIVNMRIL